MRDATARMVREPTDDGAYYLMVDGNGQQRVILVQGGRVSGPGAEPVVDARPGMNARATSPLRRALTAAVCAVLALIVSLVLEIRPGECDTGARAPTRGASCAMTLERLVARLCRDR